jgi:hypothetical protein
MPFALDDNIGICHQQREEHLGGIQCNSHTPRRLFKHRCHLQLLTIQHQSKDCNTNVICKSVRFDTVAPAVQLNEWHRSWQAASTQSVQRVAPILDYQSTACRRLPKPTLLHQAVTPAGAWHAGCAQTLTNCKGGLCQGARSRHGRASGARWSQLLAVHLACRSHLQLVLGRSIHATCFLI